jgi:hypothetical protein
MTSRFDHEIAELARMGRVTLREYFVMGDTIRRACALVRGADGKLRTYWSGRLTRAEFEELTDHAHLL